MAPEERDIWLGDLFFTAVAPDIPSSPTGDTLSGLIMTAYEELLGYDSANEMTHAHARISYWLERLESDLLIDDFVTTFLDQAHTDQGNHVPITDFEGNQKAVDAVRDKAEELFPDNEEGQDNELTDQELLEEIRTVASIARSGDREESEPAFFAITELSDETVIKVDETTTVTAKVENTGDEHATQEVVLTISNDLERMTLRKADVTLAGGAGTSVEFTIDSGQQDLDPGSYDLTVTSDDDYLGGSGSLKVEALSPSPELLIDAVEFNPEQPFANEDFSFTIDIIESANIEPDNLQLTLEVAGVTTETYDQLPSVQGQSVTSLPLDVSAIDQFGTFEASFILDADNADPAEFQRDLTVLESDTANLDVELIEVSNSAQLEPGDDFIVATDLTETDGSDVRDISVQLVIEDAGIDVELDPGALAANGSVRVESEELTIPDAGFYEAEILVDAANAEESRATAGFTVTTLPHDSVTISEALELLWTEDTTSFPFSAIGQLQVKHEDSGGAFSAGSGVMISPQHVMTNHHVLQGAHLLDEIEQINFFSGLNGNVHQAFDDQAFTPGDTETDDGIWSLEGDIFADDSAAEDIAIVRLDEAIDEISNGYFDWFWNAGGGDRDLTAESVMWSGYPVQDMEQSDPATQDPDYFQWQAFGEIEGYEHGNGQLALSDSLMGRSGASGSPLFHPTEDGAELVALYTGRIDFNGDQVPVATTLTPDIHDWALEIIQNDGYLQDQEFAV